MQKHLAKLRMSCAQKKNMKGAQIVAALTSTDRAKERRLTYAVRQQSFRENFKAKQAQELQAWGEKCHPEQRPCLAEDQT